MATQWTRQTLIYSKVWIYWQYVSLELKKHYNV